MPARMIRVPRLIEVVKAAKKKRGRDRNATRGALRAAVRRPMGGVYRFVLGIISE